MSNYCAENERIKHKYFGWMRDAQQCCEATVDSAAKALSRFEEYTRHRSFRAFHNEQASAFKRHLADQPSHRSGERLSKATLHATLTQLRSFFRWLADEPRYKSRLQRSDADYFRLPKKDAQIATTERERKAPTLEQVRYVIDAMPM
jgi:site-specific recombinase XerD